MKGAECRELRCMQCFEEPQACSRTIPSVNAFLSKCFTAQVYRALEEALYHQMGRTGSYTSGANWARAILDAVYTGNADSCPNPQAAMPAEANWSRWKGYQENAV